jgi:uncharacterized membrane protein YhaH (DUF805 family)
MKIANIVFFLSVSGRINRAVFTKGLSATILTPLAIFFMALLSFPEDEFLHVSLLIILSFTTIWLLLTLHVKRLHDCDRSGWYLLISLIPVLGSLYIAVLTFLTKGTSGPNRFDTDPSTIAKKPESSTESKESPSLPPVQTQKMPNQNREPEQFSTNVVRRDDFPILLIPQIILAVGLIIGPGFGAFNTVQSFQMRSWPTITGVVTDANYDHNDRGVHYANTTVSYTIDDKRGCVTSQASFSSETKARKIVEKNYVAAEVTLYYQSDAPDEGPYLDVDIDSLLFIGLMQLGIGIFFIIGSSVAIAIISSELKQKRHSQSRT